MAPINTHQHSVKFAKKLVAPTHPVAAIRALYFDLLGRVFAGVRGDFSALPYLSRCRILPEQRTAVNLRGREVHTASQPANTHHDLSSANLRTRNEARRADALAWTSVEYALCPCCPSGEPDLKERYYEDRGGYL